MHLRIVQVLIFAVLTLPLSGCPSLPIELGRWVFETDANSTSALVLLRNGTTVKPDDVPIEVDSEFAGVVTWEVDGDTFSMVQIVDGAVPAEFRFDWVGTIESPTRMTGTIVNEATNWVATYTP